LEGKMNEALKRLGFGEKDRVTIIHADDVGMCQATLTAIADVMEFGVVSSAAVMVPCPWFPEVAAFCRAHPEVDMGVHLTVNSEWESYRWGPISTRDVGTGMIDEQGYFHQWQPATWEKADPAAVGVEMRAQVARAISAGIVPTHVDSHMGTVARPPFTRAYVDVALENRVPLLFVEGERNLVEWAGITQEQMDEGLAIGRELAEKGVPLFDAIDWLPLDDPVDNVGVAKKIIDEMKPGLTVLLLHPAVDTPELRAIAPDWPSRVANYEAMLSWELRDYVRQSGVQVIGYRPLLDLVRR
jgi:predicted glycoside hydrolase/deacetylase ChbG (UPF0249 family)